MATIVNELDVTLQSASSRDLDPRAGKYIILEASTPAFRVSSGVGSPTSITLTALPVNIPAGTVSWSITAGTLTGTGNTRVLAFSNMPVDAVTVTVSITDLGETYTANYIISKVYDGTNGGPGVDGARGAGQYYAAGSSWNDTTANGATPGVNVLDDIVTIYNGTTFSETRRWNGSAWVAISKFLDGGVLTDASLGTAKFASSIEPVTLVSSVPGVKSTSTVFNTTDGKLYRWNGAAYVATVPTTDLNGTITDAQIAALAATKLTGTITTTQITDNAISTPKLATGAVVAGKIAAGAVDTSKLLVTSKGNCINDDPYLEDVANCWDMGSGIAVFGPTTAPGSTSGLYFSNLTVADSLITSKRSYAVDSSKTYSLTANLFAGTANTRSMLIFIDFFDNAGAFVGTAWGGTKSGYTYFSTPTIGQFTILGGQFGANTSRAIPTNARTCKIGVWTQYSGSGSGFAQHAVQDIRLERVSGSTLIADGAITTDKIIANAIDASKIQADAITAGKISAGAISAREIAANSILAKNLVLANKDDVSPDPTFSDPSFWFPALGGVYPTGVSKQYNLSYPVSSVLLFTNVTALDTISRQVVVEKGAVYRYKVTIWKDAGVSGNFTFTLHVPGVVYSPLGIPRTGTVAGYGNGIDWASVPSTSWTTYTGVITASIYDYLDFRIWGSTSGGGVYIAVELVRANDASLIVDGAITASKISVANLSAVSANIGTLRTATSGARTEISDNVIKVYDASNVLRVKIGDLSL